MISLDEINRNIPFHCFGRSFVSEVFIETGTEWGFTTALAYYSKFHKIHTVDINHEVAERARTIFTGADSIHVHEGDSRVVLPSIVNLDATTTFWLDAHSPDDCPLLDELRIILGMKWTVMPLIMIDDVGEMISAQPSWPSWPSLVEVMRLLWNYSVCIPSFNELLKLLDSMESADGRTG